MRFYDAMSRTAPVASINSTGETIMEYSPQLKNYVVIRKGQKLDVEFAKKHNTRDEAITEAKRLCEKEHDIFFIYKIELVNTVRIAPSPVEVINAEDCFE